MLEILISVFTIFMIVLAAKKGRRRRFNLRKVRVTSTLAVGALAALDVAAGNLTNVVTDEMRFISCNFAYTWSTISGGTDDSMEFGLAHSDYTAAEIEECLEAGASIEIGDKIAQERANRLVRSVGIIANETASVAAKFNNGMKVKTKLNWLIGEGFALQAWVRNATGTVYTTGSSLIVSGELWVKD